MGRKHERIGPSKKKLRATTRETSDALFFLRCLQLGLRVGDLELVTVGMVFDLIAESANDQVNYPVVATQEDFDKF